ncbi:MAG: cyclohexanecarboxylate-CoA ligase, partial [Ilumatobacteraceae bacterium]
VIGVPDERTGERCCAVVQLVDGAGPIGLRELAELCEQHGLAKQKFPEQLELVDEIPRNAMGKIEKQRLRAELATARHSS